ncbi:MAG: Fic family protein [Elusimicrobia bacterium]|nr:Fic family protein [Elusimicrobiota bacterium]
MPRVYKLLEEISRVREQLRSSLVKVPWVPSLVRDAMARAAWGSTAIEGCTLSLEAIKGLMEGKEAVGYPDRHVRMAQNYLDALTWLQGRAQSQGILEKDILHLHKIIAEGAVDDGPIGSYRRTDVRAGLHVCPPWRQAPLLTRDMLSWLNKSAGELPAVFSSAILHLRFVEIHPFRDGNGRVGRALATWQLYRMGFDTLHVFALDEVLLENRAFYIKNLQRVQVEREDLGGWLEFMAEAILETLERVQKRIQALGLPGKEPLSLTLRQEKLLRLLRERGPLAIREIARALRVTPPGAHYALKPLLRSGVIKTIGIHKSTRYLLS